MPRSPNIFNDPTDVLPEYPWPVNHLEEEETGEGRDVERTATTSGVGLVRQQGAEQPLTLVYRGTILHPEQHDMFIAYQRACRTRTILFTDFAGDEYEVLITRYKPRRERVALNSKGGTVAPLHIWRYTLEMDVISVIAGPWE